MKTITSEQLKAARALLQWEQKRLAEESGVSLPTIGRIEAKPGPLSAYGSTVAALKSAIERAGVLFIESGEASGEGGAGVRLTSGSARLTKHG